eukprot:scaffold9.g3287.t1
MASGDDGHVAPAAAVTDRLHQRLKAASQEIHSTSDALVNSRLIGLFGSRQLYGQAIACFYWVFKEIEDSLAATWGKDKRLAALRPAIEPVLRTGAFEEDLAFYLGPDWRSQARPAGAARAGRAVAPMPEVQAYQGHLRRLAAETPLALLAHSYTQHVALLAGGQIIRKMARKRAHMHMGMALPEGAGVAIYGFPGRVGVSDLKRNYKQKLDATAREAMSEEEVQQLEVEHVRAFQFNNATIRAFRMGWLRGGAAMLRAAVALLPLRLWVAAATALAAVVILYWARNP